MDTNVVVSAALLPHSLPRQAFDRALEHGIFLHFVCHGRGMNDVLRRPRFDTYVHEDERLAFLKIDAEVQCPVNGGDRLLIVTTRIEIGHAYAAKAESRNDKATFAKLTL